MGEPQFTVLAFSQRRNEEDGSQKTVLITITNYIFFLHMKFSYWKTSDVSHHIFTQLPQLVPSIWDNK